MGNQSQASGTRFPGESLFPLFITTEHVLKGYIIIYWDEHQGRWVKEIVPEDQIYRRFGELVHLDNIGLEKPVIYRIEAVSETAYERAGSVPIDSLTQAKIHYLHFKTRNAPKGSVWGLKNLDANTYEFYGDSAEAVAAGLERRMDSIPKIGGVAFLSFKADKETNKTLVRAVPNFKYIEVSEQDAVDWHRSHSSENVLTEQSQDNSSNNKEKKQ